MSAEEFRVYAKDLLTKDMSDDERVELLAEAFAMARPSLWVQETGAEIEFGDPVFD